MHVAGGTVRSIVRSFNATMRFVIAIAAIGGAVTVFFVFRRPHADGLPTQGASLVSPADARPATEMEPASERRRWAERIAAVGAKNAYEEFKEIYAARHFSVQHAVAHIVGDLIYEAEGIGGVAVCDSAFSFGCYHSFFGRAIATEGPAVAKILDEACIAAYGPLGLGCQHGIGHGALEYFGSSRLEEALEVCASLAWQEPLLGCQSGVLMEYNFPVLTDGPTPENTVREPEPGKLHEPCPSVPERFRSACYYELGAWWSTFHDYAEMGRLCEVAPEAHARTACFLGIGNIAAPAHDYAMPDVIGACRSMPDGEGTLKCLAGASWAFFAVPERRALASGPCETLASAVDRARCVRLADFFGTQSGRAPET